MTGAVAVLAAALRLLRRHWRAVYLLSAAVTLVTVRSCMASASDVGFDRAHDGAAHDRQQIDQPAESIKSRNRTGTIP